MSTVCVRVREADVSLRWLWGGEAGTLQAQNSWCCSPPQGREGERFCRNSNRAFGPGHRHAWRCRRRRKPKHSVETQSASEPGTIGLLK